jgi:hypothetical protein
MNQKILLETIGTIEKKEMLGPAGFKELVLEAFQPFPGYEGKTETNQKKPNSLFAITRSKYTEEKIIRVIQKIKNDHKYSFDATPGMVTLYNMLNPCVRFKDLKSYDEVPAILEAFEDDGIEFMSNRNVEPFVGVIKVKKYFLVEVLSDYLFKAVDEPHIYYFTVPAQLRFNQFEKMTAEVKHTLNDANFDAALGTIFRKTGLIDIIRIYDEKCTADKIDVIRNKYLEAISHLSK